MKPSPISYASLATLYIIFIVSVGNLITKFGHDKPDTILTPFFAPMFMLSLLVLSVAIMAFLFFYQPLKLLLDNKRNEAILFFGKTLGMFAIFVVIIFAVVFYTII